MATEWKCLTTQHALISCEVMKWENFRIATYVSISFRSEMMCKCWLLKAEDRPNFSNIAAILSTRLESLSEYLNLVIPNSAVSVAQYQEVSTSNHLSPLNYIEL